MLYPESRTPEVPARTAAADAEAEVRRLDAAFDAARRELERVRLRVRVDVGSTEAEIFDAHEALLSDRDVRARMDERIRRDRISAEQAVDAELADAARRLAAVEEPYLRERALDLRDVARRLLATLAPRQGDAIAPLPSGSVIVAVELLPSETVDLDRAHVAAVVTEVGGETSHVAILARALGIPAVSAIDSATAAIRAGEWLLVDGDRGEVTVAPSPERRRAFAARSERWARSAAAASAAEDAECVTRDGERIALHANLGRAEEVHDVRRHRLEAVGLFRTEFLFLDSPEPPSFERQLDVYRRAIDALGGLPLTIRTLDLGADKIPPFLTPHSERNPSLGLRGLRFSLRERELFTTQLRAIAQAAERGPVRVLFPMVLGDADLREAKARLAEAGAGTAALGSITVGAMIETPAAVLLIDEILEEVDFVSLGTNDLTQFTLAADRDAVDLLDGYSVLHPSVLRSIARVVEAARKHGRRLSVCGEAAGDPATAALLAGLGVRELSMSPLRAARVRYALRRTACREAEALARRLLASRSVDESRRELAAFSAELEPGGGEAAPG